MLRVAVSTTSPRGAAMVAQTLARGFSVSAGPLLSTGEAKSSRVDDLKKKIADGPGFSDFVGGADAMKAAIAGEEK